MEYRNILHKKEGRVVTIVLNRPRTLNALSSEMIEELLDAARQTGEDGEAKVLILTGAGRAFCFGADISLFRRTGGMPQPDIVHALLAKSQEMIRCLSGMPKPTIAALNGFATGLGLDIAMACDLRIAAEGAKLGESFISMGLVPDGGGTYFLPRLVGMARAAEMIFTGEPIAAKEAERMGLINLVVPGQDLEKTARRWADKFTSKSSLALALAKKAIWESLSGDLNSALKMEAECQKMCLQSPEHNEAVEAFLARHSPLSRSG